MQSIWARLGIALAAVVMVSSFQNCGQAPETQAPANTQEEDQIVRAMEDESAASNKARAITSLKVDAAADCRVENLRCIRKIYSPQARDHSLTESICLDGTGVCLDVQTHTYNSSTALAACANCGEAEAAPGGAYNREEVTCWLGEPGQPSARVFALRSTLDEAVEATLEACSGEQQ